MNQGLTSEILKIEGMSCASCEIRIEKALIKLHGITDVKASFSSSKVKITYNRDEIELNQIIEKIEALDYKVKNKSGQKNNSRLKIEKAENDRFSAKQFFGIGAILLTLYITINNTIGFNFIPEVNQSMGYGILLIIGMLTSLHCIVMCGGINVSQCVSYRNDSANDSRLSSLKPSMMYNSGRIISYTVIGGIVGALGSVVSFSGTAKGFVAVISGLFMIIMGLNMLNIFPWLRRLNPRMPKFFGIKIHSGKYGPFYIGLLNGLMPCGPLQAMQIYALGTGNFAAGAMSMFMFSIGTVPLMFSLGAMSSILSGKFTHKMLKVSAMLVIILGVVMTNRGLTLSGVNVTAASSGPSNIARIEGSIQLVSTEMKTSRYTPIIVQKGIPVKWTINVDEGALNGCNNPMIIPQFDKQYKLKEGENLIEFTPESEGNISYSCWMGMVRSNIKVVADLSGVSDEDINDVSNGGTGQSIKIPTDQIAVGEINDGIQYISLDVMKDRFSPSIIVMQRGMETKWVINGKELESHNSRIILPEYMAYIDLNEGENVVEFIPEGDFTLQCSTGELNAYVKVVDDINKIKIKDIKKEVEKYQPLTPGMGGASCH